MAHEAWLGLQLAQHVVSADVGGFVAVREQPDASALYVLFDWHGGATLQQGAQASFEMPPERKPRTEQWHGGMVRLPALVKPGIYQITLSDDAWIDVIQNGRYARSVGSTGRSDCPGVRKSVRLDLDGSPVVLQVSGVALDTIAVTIGAVE